MATTHLPLDFKEFLQFLASRSVEYLLVGGYAVNLHGFIRTTGDIDIWIAASPENARKMVEVLKDFGFGSLRIPAETFTELGNAIRMGEKPFKIEILTQISGVSFEEAWAGRIEMEVDGVPIHLISLNDLRKNKAASGRPQDLADLSRLPKAP